MKRSIAMGLTLILSLICQSHGATFTVDIASDDADAHDSNPGDGICADDLGFCTLRAAIQEANSTAAPDVILFADGFVNARLVLAASEGELPVINTEIAFLGYSIDAYNGSATLLRNAPPQFTIDGSNLDSGNGLTFSGAGASGSTVSALAVVNFPSDGIVMALGADGIAINRSYIGINPDGSSGGNGSHGINAILTDGHHIGKSRHSNGTHFVSLGNVISLNGGSGIRFFDSNDNHINGNLIGISQTGSGDRGNGGFGIDMYGDNNQAGDFIGTNEAGNFIAANDSGGITIDGDNNRIYNNSLGKGETGSFIDSEGDGIFVIGELNFIGNNDLAGNEIYEHFGAAIGLGESGVSEANNNFIINNTIGSSGAFLPLNRSGNGEGIMVNNGNTNVIQFNTVINSGTPQTTGYGIYVRGGGHSISGNQVGFVNSLFGPVSEANLFRGVVAIGDNNTIGTSTNPNYIGGNNNLGVYVEGSDINVSYNFIGISESNQAIGNNGIGLYVLHNSGGLVVEHNLIGNNIAGITFDYPTNTPNIRFNRVGVGLNGVAMGNQNWGVMVRGGQTSDISYNTIANNGWDGIAITSAGNFESEGIAVFQNSMYDNGVLAIDLGDDGVTDNDNGDFDEGNNRLQNKPVIESIQYNQQSNPKTVTIGYRVDTNSNAATYPLFIDFYWSDIDLNSQGRYFLGTDFNYTTANALKTVTFDFDNDSQGAMVTATALDQGRNVSEMSDQFQFGVLDIIFKSGFE